MPIMYNQIVLNLALHDLPPLQIFRLKYVYTKDSQFYYCAFAPVLQVLFKCLSVESRLPFLPLNPPYLFVTPLKGRSDWGIKKISHFIQRQHLMKFCSPTRRGTKYLKYHERITVRNNKLCLSGMYL